MMLCSKKTGATLAASNRWASMQPDQNQASVRTAITPLGAAWRKFFCLITIPFPTYTSRVLRSGGIACAAWSAGRRCSGENGWPGVNARCRRGTGPRLMWPCTCFTDGCTILRLGMARQLPTGQIDRANLPAVSARPRYAKVMPSIGGNKPIGLDSFGTRGEAGRFLTE